MSIKKIMCFCGSGLGSSFIIEMNIKKALKKMGIQGVEVSHTNLENIAPGVADLFICGNDLAVHAAKAGPYIALNNLVSADEMEKKLSAYFAENEK